MAKKESFELVYGISQRLLEKIGTPTGCSAKWYQSTIHLQNGLTQSCYNTPQHKVGLQRIKISPKALHNTPEKAKQRKQMLAGERPKGCEYCWNIEDQKANTLSDRHQWNCHLASDANAHVEELAKHPANYMFNPKVLEVSFANTCNFMCGYCHPKNSSRFYNEIKKFGKYKGDSHQCDIKFVEIFEEEENPYLDAFWEWWPELSQNLKTIRLTGGEPLVQKSTKRLLESLLESPRPNLVLAINTNMGMAPKLFRENMDLVKKLIENNSIYRLEIFTSLDTWGEQAKYIRYGLDLDIFQENMDYFLEHFPKQRISFMVTFNIFSPPRFTDLMQYWLDLKTRFNKQEYNRVYIDLNILTEPLVFSYLLLPESYILPIFDRCLEFARNHFDDTSMLGFSNLMEADINKLRNGFLLNKLPPKELSKARKSFKTFFAQYDERKEISLIETFPEYKDIISSW